MTVMPVYAHRIIWCLLVDPLFSRKQRGIELLVIPISIEYPLPFFDRLSPLCNEANKIFPAFCLPQQNACKRKSSIQEMGVAVDETGKNEGSLEIDALSCLSNQFENIFVRSDCNDLVF
jgi:hypothetical protein